MNERVVIAAAVAALVAIAVAAMHERHYRSRTDRVQDARLAGRLAATEARLLALETILTEDRLT